MEAVPRLPMLCCDMKVSPNNTEFGQVLKKHIRDHYHEDPESYTKEIKELETLRQNAIKAPMDFTGCSILKRYYSQLHKLQSRFPMTDDGLACVPFMWTDIYSRVAYNITDIEYEEACILYNIGALHSKLGTMDSRCNAEGMKVACTHFQCAAWAFQHLRDTFPQPKGSDMSHDLLILFINIMLAQAQQCILEKSMLDSRKSSITAKIAAQVVDYYKCALGILVSGSPGTDAGSILDIVGSKTFKGWRTHLEFQMSYHTSISHLYMGCQAEENEKWGERVAWFQSAYDFLTEAFKIAKSLDKDGTLNEPLTFTMDVIGGKLNSSKKENEFVYHDKVPALSSLPELKGASLVKGIPFSVNDPDVSGPDIFARLVPMEAHETSSLYSEEKAKLLRSVVVKIEEKNEELMAYLSSLQLESGLSFQDEEKIPQELLEKCAAVSVQPNAISDIKELMNELLSVSKEVDTALKTTSAILEEEEKKELQHQEAFGKRGPSMIIVELRKECSKYDEAHRKAIESNKTLETFIDSMTRLLLPPEELAAMLPSVNSVKTPENEKNINDFNHLVNKVEEMRKQRQFLEQQLRDSLMSDDITKALVTKKKTEDLKETFTEELKKHSETVTYLEQNLSAQDNILRALTEANANYAETRKVMTNISHQRMKMVGEMVNSFDAYDDLVSKAKKGLEFYEKLQSNVTRLLTRARSVTKVQDEERSQMANADISKGIKNSTQSIPNHLPETQGMKLKDYLPFMSKQGGSVSVPPGLMNPFPPQQHTMPPTNSFPPEPMRQATPGGPAAPDFIRSLKPVAKEEIYETPSMGVRPRPVGSEQTSVPAMCTTAISSSQVANFPYSKPLPQSSVVPASPYDTAYTPYQYPGSPQFPPANNSRTFPSGAPQPNATFSQMPASMPTQNFGALAPMHQTGPAADQSNTKANFNHTVGSFPQHSACSGVPQYGNVPPGSASTMLSVTQYGVPPQSGTSVMPSASQYVAMPQNSRPPVPSIASHGTMPHSGVSSILGSPQYGNMPQSGISSMPATIQYGSMPQGGRDPGSGNLSMTSIPQVNDPSRSHMAVPQTMSSSLPSSSTIGSHSNMSYVNNAAVGINAFGQNVPALQRPGSVPPLNSMAYQACDKNQMPSTWSQTNQMTNYNASIPGHTGPPQLQNSKSISNTNPHQTAQYYQTNSHPVAANVTASMDTRTRTQSSSQHHASSNLNPMYFPQQNTFPGNVGSSTTGGANMQYQSYPQQFQNPSQFSNKPPSPGTIPSTNVSTYSAMSYNYPNNFQNVSNQSLNTEAAMSSVTQNVYTGAANINSANIPSNNICVARSSATNVSASVSPVCMPGSTNPMMAGQLTGPMNSLIPNQNSTNPMVGSKSGQFIGSVNSAVTQNHGTVTNGQLNQMSSNSANNTFSYAMTYNPNQSFPSNQNQIPPQFSPIVPCSALQPIQSPIVQDKSPVKCASQLGIGENLNAVRDLITPPSQKGDLEDSNPVDKEVNSQVLQPKVMDLKSIPQPKEKEPLKDPLDDPAVRSKFVNEVEKYEKFVDGLVRKSLNGTMPLDQKWKEFIDAQDKESRKMSISVARCYPLKNRFPDVMPYDSNRVKLVSAKDDYINASYLKEICPNSPVFVITQAPLPSTFNDFWLMVWEQQVETLICLLPDSELKNHIYFPKERGQVLPYGAFETSLHSYREKNGFVERMINITHVKNRTSRVVVHLQFTQWPVSGIPQSPAPLLQFISDVLSYQKQQRNLLRPVVVHCSAGIGRSGCFCLITALVNEMNSGISPRDVSQLVTNVNQQRKFLIQDKEQLKFCYDTVLYYAQDLLMKRGILTTRATFDNKLPGSGNTSSHVRHPSEDFILGSGGLAKLQSGMEKMGLTDSPVTTDSTSNSEPHMIVNGDKLEGYDDNVTGNKPNGDVPEDRPNDNVPEDKFIDNALENKPNDDVPEIKTNDNIIENKPEDNVEICTEASEAIKNDDNDKAAPSITSLLDPLNFTLEGTGNPAKRKITKENFARSKGSLSTSSSDSADPLSQLDPLWSLKK